MKDFFSLIQFKADKPEKGQLLISEPLLEDPFFKRSVILIVDHSKEEGSVGLMLNKTTSTQISNIIPDFPEINTEVYIGGPVNSNHLYYLHNRQDLLPDSRKIKEGLFWGGDFEKLKSVIASGQMTSNQVRFFSGYSGWDKNQLEKELKEKSWITTKTNIATILQSLQKNMWKKLLQKMGKRFEIMSRFPESPALN